MDEQSKISVVTSLQVQESGNISLDLESYTSIAFPLAASIGTGLLATALRIEATDTKDLLEVATTTALTMMNALIMGGTVMYGIDLCRKPRIENFKYPEIIPDEPIAIVVTTVNEEISILEPTLRSIFKQNYAYKNLRIVLSNDGHYNNDLNERNRELEKICHDLQIEFPEAEIKYCIPPEKGTSGRRGVRKSGNLNSVLEALENYFPECEKMMVLDADDMLLDPLTLASTVSYMNKSADRIGFIQTIKTVDEPNDAFANEDTVYQKNILPGRSNPTSCGSGVLYDLKALKSINGFPVDSVNEDTAVSMEFFRNGYRSLHLPINGVVTNNPPPDAEAYIKQREGWAKDTFHLFNKEIRKQVRREEDRLQLRDLYTILDLGFSGYFVPIVAAAMIVTGSFTEIFDIGADDSTQQNIIRTMVNALNYTTLGALLLNTAKKTGISVEYLFKDLSTYLGMAPGNLKSLTNVVVSSNLANGITRKSGKREMASWPYIVSLAALYSVSLTPIFEALAEGNLLQVINTLPFTLAAALYGYFLYYSLQRDKSEA